MKLVFLGTGGYFPNTRRHTACIVLPELGVVLDAGTGMFRLRDYLPDEKLQIFLTHAHLDHVVGLTYLLGILHERPVPTVRVYGDGAKLQALKRHLFAPELFPVQPDFEWHELGGEVPLPRAGRLTHFPLRHPGGSLGYRLDWPDRSLAYVTDTSASADAAYLDAIRGVDVLIHECYFADGHEQLAELTGHSCTTPVAQVAKAAAVGRLLLVHANPLVPKADPVGLSQAQQIFAATEMAEDGLELEF